MGAHLAAAEHPVGDIEQAPADPGGREYPFRVGYRPRGQAPRLFEAEQRGVGRLAGVCVLACRLADLLLRTLDVEDVVNDLESQAEVRRIPVDGIGVRVRRAAHERPGYCGGADERTGLALVHGAKSLGIECG